MAAYTTSLRLTLPVTGTEDGTWGDTVNNGITSLTDSAVAGTATVVQGDVANYTLTNSSGATDEARNMFLNITGALTAARNVVCPAVSKLYFIKNSTTGGFAVTLKTSGGTGISVPNGAITVLYCDGTNVVDAVSRLSSLTLGSALPVASGGIGVATLAANNVILGNGTSAVQVVAPGTSGNVLTSNGTTWTSATAAAGDVTLNGTQTLTNKRITQRVNSAASTTSPWAWNSDSYDVQEFTALANALTINADAGTPTDGQKTIFRFQDNGVARALTWTTGSTKSFRAIGVNLPTTTVISKTVYIGCIYNLADTRWDAVAVAQEA